MIYGFSPLAWRLWHLIVDCGDIFFIVPAFVALGALRWREQPRDIAGWAVMLALTAVIIFVLKVTVGTFDFWIGGQNIRARSAPSGHVGMSFVFYAQLALMMWQSDILPVRYLAIVPLIILMLVTCATYVLGWHSLLDITSAIGLGTVMLLAFNYWRSVGFGFG